MEIWGWAVDFEPVVVSRKDRIRSAAVTAGAAFVLFVGATIVGGLFEFVASAVSGHGIPGAKIAGQGGGMFGSSNEQNWDYFRDDVPLWASVGVLVFVVLFVGLGASRAGIGTPGDSLMEVVTRTPDGQRVSRTRTIARTVIPVAIFMGLSVFGHAGLGLALCLLLWVPALFRADRRSAYDLITGVCPLSYRRAHTRLTRPQSTAHDGLG